MNSISYTSSYAGNIQQGASEQQVSNKTGIVATECLKITCCLVTAVCLYQIKRLQPEETDATQLQEQINKNRKIIALKTIFHSSFFGIILLSLLEQALTNPANENFNSIWNELQLGQAFMHALQTGTSGYQVYVNHLAPQLKKNRISPIDASIAATANEAETAALLGLEASKQLSDRAYLADVTKTIIIITCVASQIFLSAAIMVNLYKN